MIARQGPSRTARLALAGVILGVVFAAGALVARSRTASVAQAPASSSEVAASLAQGVAWIWPDSNGPRPSAGFREAAVLVESLVLRAQGVERASRTQPLLLPPNVRIVPVLHVEAAADAPSTFTPAQRDAIVAAAKRHVELAVAGAGLLQLDFEAPARQREAYRELVATLRQALPPEVRLGVTALAHWCTQGDWLDRLPVDEVVPMLYRLGANPEEWRGRFVRNDATLARRCRGPALGFATNDPPPRALLARATRPYWFDESAWSNPSRPPPHLLP